METTTLNGDDTAVVNSEKFTKRSPSYAQRPLPEIISFVSKIYTELGHSHYHSREKIAGAHRLAVPTIKTPLSTSQQYGLLELKHGTGFKVTPLFIKIYRPKNDKEKMEAIIESLCFSELYRGLITEFKGHVVPSLAGVSNMLIRDYQIQESVAEAAAGIFIENLKHYGLLNDNNVLLLSPTISTPQNENPETPIPTPIKSPEVPPKREEVIDNDYVEIPIPLKSSNKKAKLIIPHDFSDEDLERISKFVEALR